MRTSFNLDQQKLHEVRFSELCRGLGSDKQIGLGSDKEIGLGSDKQIGLGSDKQIGVAFAII